MGKYYAVAKGRQTGIFTQWPECQKNVTGYPGAKYKSFTTKTEALEWLAQGGKVTAGSKRNHVITKTSLQQPDIKVYTDGGARKNNNQVTKDTKAAWAYIVITKERDIWQATAGEYGSTNNQMELTAVLQALKFLIAQQYTQKAINLYSDSKYVIDAIQKNWLVNWQKRGWKKADNQPVANQELWQEISQCLAQFKQLELVWVKGHAENKGNDLVDKLLNKTMDEM
ncbi:ribonuclease H family protein [Ligilactobacillus ceti]|uniref:Ribonuclease H n=1 Tax=Ligilactobacillus ceti DSM 22408 TaxID=1122146 RepID=A0A0R2KKS3_9LACO|nr:ribonuclease H family protein [Ligilactobacillus ceti]KRN89984.1 ribonuclease HI [Ligilactobacillus ceti DSM 22408]